MKIPLQVRTPMPISYFMSARPASVNNRKQESVAKGTSDGNTV